MSRDDLIGSLRLRRFPPRTKLRLIYVVLGRRGTRYDIMYLFGDAFLHDTPGYDDIIADEELAHA